MISQSERYDRFVEYCEVLEQDPYYRPAVRKLQSGFFATIGMDVRNGFQPDLNRVLGEYETKLIKLILNTSGKA